MSPKQQLRLIKDWNQRHQAGTAVVVTLDDKSEKQTTTRSEAWLLGGHTAVVMLEGISGAYALERVRSL